MKMLLVLISVPFIISFAQDNVKQEPTVNISGFIKNDFFFDSRQTSNFREGHFLLYPENKLPDEYGKDINAKSSLNALSIQSRITGKFNGPDVLGGKLTGMLEGEFFGTSVDAYLFNSSNISKEVSFVNSFLSLFVILFLSSLIWRITVIRNL